MKTTQPYAQSPLPWSMCHLIRANGEWCALIQDANEKAIIDVRGETESQCRANTDIILAACASLSKLTPPEA